MAGHKEHAESYFIPRAGIQPPQILLDMIFSFADVELERIDSSVNTTAFTVLNLLINLKSVIIQVTLQFTIDKDVAELMDNGIEHILFNESVFKHPAFIEYKRELLIYMVFIKLDC